MVALHGCRQSKFWEEWVSPRPSLSLPRGLVRFPLRLCGDSVLAAAVQAVTYHHRYALAVLFGIFSQFLVIFSMTDAPQVV